MEPEGLSKEQLAELEGLAHEREQEVRAGGNHPGGNNPGGGGEETHGE
jgi:hypothetical protein